MDEVLYKVIHLVGAFCLFVGFGGLFTLGETRSKTDKFVAGFHGAGLLLLFLSGFMIQAKAPYIEGFPMWLIAKIALWLVMVALFVMAKRKVINSTAGVFGALIVGAVVAYLCLYKPF